MKIIISHDVDHLYGRDHWLRDLVYPKLWIRETINLCKRSISLREWFLRCESCFRHKRNYIHELVEFDLKHNVPSTFFFGMNKGLGMSYKPQEAKDMISFVHESGLGVGVHGICYDQREGIENERTRFRQLMDFEPEGIRMHYVRYNNQTFQLLDMAGYNYDSTEFDKQTGITLKNPYKVGNMWEFPVCIMDTYLPYDLEKAKKITLECIQRAEELNCRFFTILFHDVNYCEEKKQYKMWYEWLIKYIIHNNYEIDSYKNAIKDMESGL